MDEQQNTQEAPDDEQQETLEIAKLLEKLATLLEGIKIPENLGQNLLQSTSAMQQLLEGFSSLEAEIKDLNALLKAGAEKEEEKKEEEKPEEEKTEEEGDQNQEEKTEDKTEQQEDLNGAAKLTLVLLKDIDQQYQEMIKSGQKFGHQGLNTLEVIWQTMEISGQMMSKTGKSARDFDKTMQALAPVGREISQSLGTFYENLASRAQAILDKQNELEDFKQEVQSLGLKISLTSSNLQRLEQEEKQRTKRIEQLQKQQAARSEELAKLKEQAASDPSQENSDRTKQLKNEQKLAKKQLESLTKESTAAQQEIAQQKAHLEQLQAQQKAISNTIGLTMLELERLKDKAKVVAKDITDITFDSIYSFFGATINLGEAFGNKTAQIIGEALTSNVEGIQAQVDQVFGQIEQRQDAIYLNTVNQKKLDQQRIELALNLAQAEQSLAKAKQNKNQEDQDKYAAEIQALKAEQRANNSAIEVAKFEFDQLIKHNTKYLDNLELEQLNMKKLQIKKQELEAKLKAAKQSLAKEDNSDEDTDKYEQEIKRLLADQKSNTKDIKTSQKRIDDLKIKGNLTSKEMQKLEGQKKALEDQLQEAQKALAQAATDEQRTAQQEIINDIKIKQSDNIKDINRVQKKLDNLKVSAKINANEISDITFDVVKRFFSMTGELGEKMSNKTAGIIGDALAKSIDGMQENVNQIFGQIEGRQQAIHQQELAIYQLKKEEADLAYERQQAQLALDEEKDKNKKEQHRLAIEQIEERQRAHSKSIEMASLELDHLKGKAEITANEIADVTFDVVHRMFSLTDALGKAMSNRIAHLAGEQLVISLAVAQESLNQAYGLVNAREAAIFAKKKEGLILSQQESDLKIKQAKVLSELAKTTDKSKIKEHQATLKAIELEQHALARSRAINEKQLEQMSAKVKMQAREINNVTMDSLASIGSMTENLGDTIGGKMARSVGKALSTSIVSIQGGINKSFDALDQRQKEFEEAEINHINLVHKELEVSNQLLEARAALALITDEQLKTAHLAHIRELEVSQGLLQQQIKHSNAQITLLKESAKLTAIEISSMSLEIVASLGQMSNAIGSTFGNALATGFGKAIAKSTLSIQGFMNTTYGDIEKLQKEIDQKQQHRAELVAQQEVKLAQLAAAEIEANQTAIDTLVAELKTLQGHIDQTDEQLETLNNKTKGNALRIGKMAVDIVGSVVGMVGDMTNAIFDDKLDKMNARYDKQLKELQSKHDDHWSAIEERQEQAMKALAEQTEVQGQLYAQMSEQLQEKFNDGLLSEKEYEEALKELQEQKALEEEERKAEEAELMMQIEQEKRQKEDEEAALVQEKERIEDERRRKQDEIERKRFNADKANSLVQIAINTASAILGIWSSFASLGLMGPVMAGVQIGVVSAMGIAQAAVVSSKQYTSQYASGTAYSDEGMALVGEGGPEIIELPKGSKVSSAGQTRNMLQGSGVVVHVHVNAPVYGVEDLEKAMSQAIAQAENKMLNNVSFSIDNGYEM